MKVVQLAVEGFRSLKSQAWYPGDLNVVIGPNASGKSNLLRVLEMLNASARRGLGKYIQREGGMEAIVWDGDAQHIKVLIEFETHSVFEGSDSGPTTDRIQYRIIAGRLGSTSAYRVDYEFLQLINGRASSQPTWILDRRPGHAVIVPPGSATPVAPATSIPEDESLLSIAAGPFTANELINELQSQLAAWKIYQDFSTHRDAPIRTSQVTRAETQVEPDGQNLVSVLHTLYMTSRDFKDEINTAMRAAFGEDFQELVFPPAADQRIQMRVRWRSLRREVSAADLSDGTLRFLYLLTILANPTPPSLIAIDEPETGLHPSMLPIVAEYARDASHRAQIILTTHSPEFLDAFGEDVPTTTVVEWKDGETQLRTLSGDELTYWLQQYTLGELYRSRELEAMR
jgi:predicted ATPase